MHNVPEDQAPLEPGDDELHPELRDIVTINHDYVQEDQVDVCPQADIEVKS